ncbi:unnamed protein product [Lactuca saligna]|uniref:HAT C-terminal dimerisation domain-containing protein n=1 Tax=Lactuca saligna TaxID=75948 RepID=A0AA36E436_LACSI|nr:unnamed protein product [Lactuca saligna]
MGVDFENLLSEDDGFEKTELDDYLVEKLLPNEKVLTLMWWKCNGSKFSILQKIARDVLAIPISTVASESAFSISGNKVKCKENQKLLIRRLHMMMMLKCGWTMDGPGISPKSNGEGIRFPASVRDGDEVMDSGTGTGIVNPSPSPTRCHP